MNNPYDIHAWSEQYREDALREARVRHLLERAKHSGGPLENGSAGRGWGRLLSPLLHRARTDG